MRVLYAIDTLGSGGAQRQAVALAVRLVERGAIQARFSVYRADPFFRPRLDATGIGVTVLAKRSRYDPLFPCRLRQNLMSHPVDIIHSFLHAPGIWALLARLGMPKAARPALIASERNDRIGGSLPAALVHGVLYRGADAVTVNAQPVAAEIERRCGVERERIHYIPNGIDLGVWDQSMTGECPFDLEPGCFHIGLVGRAAPQKHQELLLEALARIDRKISSTWRVWLIGAGLDSGEAVSRLQRRSHQLGLGETVRFRPEERRIAAVMRRLSLLVLCSRHEGFPNVVLEAMAARLPVIATRVGDVPNMIDSGRSGIIVPPEDASALADALLRVWRMDAGGRAALGAAARNRVEQRFSIDEISSRYLALYAEVARSSS